MTDSGKTSRSEDPNDRPRQKSGAKKIKLFISYSHDSEAHKEWVKSLAKRLEDDGIDVIFDQQNLRISMSASIFMEESLAECDRVLIVITEAYATKSRNLTGGVAYERMIITAEIARDLRTTRFIPLLRSGEEIPAFLNDRLHVDARREESWEANYQKLLDELKRPRESSRGRIPRTPAKAERAKRERKKPEAGATPQPEESHHWSHDVHSHVGNRLYLIFLKLISTRVKITSSIVENISGAGITDYNTYELYASHDLLIRVWASQDSYYELQQAIINNKDVDARHTEFMEANGIRHFSDTKISGTHQETGDFIDELDANMIETIQDGLISREQAARLVNNGIRIPDSVRFNKDRIQFYIIVRALRRDLTVIDKFEVKAKTFSNIYNKTIYRTIGNASEAVIKGQVSRDRYYEVNDFVNSVTDALDHGDIRTETALVAQRGPSGNGRIDTRAAERHLIERKYRKLIGNGYQLTPTEDMMLLARFAEAAPAMVEDRKLILQEMIRLRAQRDFDNFDHIRSYFAEFETLLRDNLNRVIATIFGAEFAGAKDRLFSKEKIGDPNVKRIVLGDLTKIYRRLVEDHGIIRLDPLTEDEFKAMMTEAVEIRNKLMHGIPELKFWENTFQFFQGFVKIDARLYNYVDSIQ